MPSRPTHALRRRGRRLRRARPRPCRGRSPAAPRASAIGDRPCPASPSTRTEPPASSRSSARRLELLRRRASSSCSRTSRGRREHGAAVVERRLRPARAHVPRGRVGVLVEEREVLRPHAELLGDEQRQRHHGAGAVLLRAGDDRPGAVAVELHVRARRSRRSTATSRRRRRSPRRRAVRRRSRSARRPSRASPCIAIRSKHLAGGGDRALLDQRAPAQLDRVDAEGRRELVHVLLERPAHLRRGRRADRATRAGCSSRRATTRCRRSRARTARARASPPSARRSRPRRSTRRRRARAAPARATSVPSPLAPGLELDHHALAAVADREELLVAREDELHRPLGRARERRDVALEVEVALRAEAAAEQRHDHADVRLRDPERVRDPGARGVGDLRGRPDRDRSPCHWATIARGSIGTPWTGSVTYRPFTTTSAAASAASASPFTIVEKPRTLS